MCLAKGSLSTLWSTYALLIPFLRAWPTPTLVLAWENCSFTEGGGRCPDGSTCCPSQIQGISSCVPTAHSTLPRTSKTGQCCGDWTTGCPFGYQCTETDSQHKQDSSHKLCTPTNRTKIDDPWAREIPRYKLCRVPPKMQQLQGFPIPVSPKSQRFQPCTIHENDIHHICNDHEDEDWFHLGYYSSQGDITNQMEQSHRQVETVVIVIHGSLRDADDYFCTGLTLLDMNRPSNNTNYNDDKVLILAPWFASVNDETAEPPQRLLVWDDVVHAYDSFIWHLWRYGADAKNAPISSFTALDSMVEYLVTATEHFPSLEQIVVVGHSGTHCATSPSQNNFIFLHFLGWCHWWFLMYDIA